MNNLDLIWNFCIDTFLSVATVLSVSLCRLEVGSNSNLGVQIVNSKIKIDVFCKKFAHMLQTPLPASMWSYRDRHNWIGDCYKNWSEFKMIKCWLHISPSVELWFPRSLLKHIWADSFLAVSSKYLKLTPWNFISFWIWLLCQLG